MADDYLTIKEAMDFTRKSEATLRRLIRSLRAQYDVKLDDTNDRIVEKTSLLRKRDERTDRNKDPVFTWLVAPSAIEALSDHDQHPVRDDSHNEYEDRREGGHDRGPAEPETIPTPVQEDVQIPKHDYGHEQVDGPHEGGHDDVRQGGRTTSAGAVTDQLLEALTGELDEKNKQLANKDKQIDHLQIILAKTQEAALQLPPGTIIRRGGPDVVDAAGRRTASN